jgi:prepilin-type N-terminal cleavage/methylation domain-containing protein
MQDNKQTKKNKNAVSERGFTLIEMIVAVGLFAVVMVICVSTLFALVNANRKAQALQSVMNNLDISLDGMARSIREGSIYHCGGSSPQPYESRQDCLSGDNIFVFLPYGHDSSDPTHWWAYKFDNVNHQVVKSENGATGTYFPITAPEVTIDDMKFYVVGTTRDDTTQPKVVIVVKGTAAASNAKTRSSFHIQAAATQRLIDL